MLKKFPFLIGSTSYVEPADVLANVRVLAREVDDIELVFFDFGMGPPDEETVKELANIARDEGISYTVHLPINVYPVNPDPAYAYIATKILEDFIKATLPLEPRAYILHLETKGKNKIPYPEETMAGWPGRARESLVRILKNISEPRLLALENQPEYPASRLFPIIDELNLSFCLDVGHATKIGEDPAGLASTGRIRPRIIHFYRMAENGLHEAASLPLTDEEKRMIRWLKESGYGGVLTLEVFSREHFEKSLQALEAAWDEV